MIRTVHQQTIVQIVIIIAQEVLTAEVAGVQTVAVVADSIAVVVAAVIVGQIAVIRESFGVLFCYCEIRAFGCNKAPKGPYFSPSCPITPRIVSNLRSH